MYILDANVFIAASRTYYAFDLVPTFWTALEDQGRGGQLMSIDRVEEELKKGKDDLAKWASKTFKACFHSTGGQDVTTSYRAIIEWAQSSSNFYRSCEV